MRKNLILFVLVLIFLCQLYLVMRLPRADGATPVTLDQFLGLAMTAVTVVLAALALFVGYLAFIGKDHISNLALELAKSEVTKEIVDLNKKVDGILRKFESEMSSKILASDARARTDFLRNQRALAKSQASDTSISPPENPEELKPEGDKNG